MTSRTATRVPIGEPPPVVPVLPAAPAPPDPAVAAPVAPLSAVSMPVAVEMMAPALSPACSPGSRSVPRIFSSWVSVSGTALDFQ